MKFSWAKLARVHIAKDTKPTKKESTIYEELESECAYHHTAIRVA